MKAVTKRDRRKMRPKRTKPDTNQQEIIDAAIQAGAVPIVVCDQAARIRNGVPYHPLDLFVHRECRPGQYNVVVASSWDDVTEWLRRHPQQNLVQVEVKRRWWTYSDFTGAEREYLAALGHWPPD